MPFTKIFKAEVVANAKLMSFHFYGLFLNDAENCLYNANRK